jgi:glycosyltransferase involved in cell wall biosynthesis
MFRSFAPNEGFGAEEAMNLAAELGISDAIEWHDPVPFHEMFGLMRTCDLGVIAYTQKMGVNCMPNRIFEYMAFGLPVICPIFARELVSILDDTKCGLLADTEHGGSLGEAILAICSAREEARAMGLRGRRAFTQRFNMENELQPFVDWVSRGSQTASSLKVSEVCV